MGRRESKRSLNQRGFKQFSGTEPLKLSSCQVRIPSETPRRRQSAATGAPGMCSFKIIHSFRPGRAVRKRCMAAILPGQSP